MKSFLKFGEIEGVRGYSRFTNTNTALTIRITGKIAKDIELGVNDEGLEEPVVNNVERSYWAFINKLEIPFYVCRQKEILKKMVMEEGYINEFKKSIRTMFETIVGLDSIERNTEEEYPYVYNDLAANKGIIESSKYKEDHAEILNTRTNKIFIISKREIRIIEEYDLQKRFSIPESPEKPKDEVKNEFIYNFIPTEAEKELLEKEIMDRWPFYLKFSISRDKFSESENAKDFLILCKENIEEAKTESATLKRVYIHNPENEVDRFVRVIESCTCETENITGNRETRVFENHESHFIVSEINGKIKETYCVSHKFFENDENETELHYVVTNIITGETLNIDASDEMRTIYNYRLRISTLECADGKVFITYCGYRNKGLKATRELYEHTVANFDKKEMKIIYSNKYVKPHIMMNKNMCIFYMLERQQKKEGGALMPVIKAYDFNNEKFMDFFGHPKDRMGMTRDEFNSVPTLVENQSRFSYRGQRINILQNISGERYLFSIKEKHLDNVLDKRATALFKGVPYDNRVALSSEDCEVMNVMKFENEGWQEVKEEVFLFTNPPRYLIRYRKGLTDNLSAEKMPFAFERTFLFAYFKKSEKLVEIFSGEEITMKDKFTSIYGILPHKKNVKNIFDIGNKVAILFRANKERHCMIVLDFVNKEITLKDVSEDDARKLAIDLSFDNIGNNEYVKIVRNNIFFDREGYRKSLNQEAKKYLNSDEFVIESVLASLGLFD